MLVVDAAVSHLDDLQSLEDFLLNLGRKHQAVGVNTQSFAVRAEAQFKQNKKKLTDENEPHKKTFLCVFSPFPSLLSFGSSVCSFVLPSPL